jgi:hypothetical protein
MHEPRTLLNLRIKSAELHHKAFQCTCACKPHTQIERQNIPRNSTHIFHQNANMELINLLSHQALVQTVRTSTTAGSNGGMTTSSRMHSKLQPAAATAIASAEATIVTVWEHIRTH